MGAQKERYSNPFTATLSGIVDLYRKPSQQVTINEGERLEGKNIMVTGASSGLGFEVAVQLAKRGAKVWMACRSGIPEKGELVKKLSGNNRIEMLHVDLSDMDSIRLLVNALKDTGVKIDILVSNAAVVPLKSRKTKQGLEEMFMVNYLAPYLLIRLLLENDLIDMNGKETPRIIVVSSESHRNPKAFDWEDFGKYREYTAGKTVEIYGYTKLLLSTFVSELSRKLNPNGSLYCSVFSLCPGPVNSNIAREAPAIFKPLLNLVFSLFFRSPAEAVKPVVYLATAEEEKGKTFDYLFLTSRKEMDEKATNDQNGKKLWNLSEELLAKYGFVFTKQFFKEAAASTDN